MLYRKQWSPPSSLSYFHCNVTPSYGNIMFSGENSTEIYFCSKYINAGKINLNIYFFKFIIILHLLSVDSKLLLLFVVLYISFFDNTYLCLLFTNRGVYKRDWNPPEG